MKLISRTPTIVESTPRRRVIPIPLRPAFDPDAFLPEPSHVLRWPLSSSSHPELTPQFAIAHALAEPGLDWIALCRRGAHRRHVPRLRDQIAYLRAWCAVGAHDTDTAIAGFASLTRSVVGGLAPAVRDDIVNVLVNHGGADDAIRLLSKHQIRDLEIFDRLTATYLDVDRPDDGQAINDLALARDNVNRGNRCRRQARRVLLDPEPYRSPVHSGRLLFDEPHGADRMCDQLEHELACWLRPALDCAAHFKDRGIDPRTAHLLDAFYRWQEPDLGPAGWSAIAVAAMAAGPVPGAYEFAVEALEQAARTSRCEASMGRVLARRAKTLLGTPAVPDWFHDRLATLVHEPETLCD